MILFLFVFIFCYCCELLGCFGLFLDIVCLDVDEIFVFGEVLCVLVVWLVQVKVVEVVVWYLGCWMLGLDQVVELNGVLLGKFGIVVVVQVQLVVMFGQLVVFYIVICLICDGEIYQVCDLIEVCFCMLGVDEIVCYVVVEQLLDCVGSFKCEGLGIILFDVIDNCDLIVLIGLLLIVVVQLLCLVGYCLF